MIPWYFIQTGYKWSYSMVYHSIFYQHNMGLYTGGAYMWGGAYTRYHLCVKQVDGIIHGGGLIFGV